MIEIKRKEGESSNAFLYRFTKKIQQAGILKEAKKKRFSSRSQNKYARKRSALYRSAKKAEITRAKKAGK